MAVELELLDHVARQLGVAVDGGVQMLRDVAGVIEQLVEAQTVPVEELLTGGLP